MSQEGQQQRESEQAPGTGAGGLGGVQKQELPDISKAVEAAKEALGKVNIVYGANDLDMELAGHSVTDVQASLADVLNVDRTAEAYVNGTQVNGNYQLKAGDRLEFMKESGQKG